MVIGGFCIFVFSDNEPRYQGRRLSEWIRGARNVEDDLSWDDASDAVRHIGSNAIPWLMKWGMNQDSFVREPIVNWVNLHLSSRIHWQTQDERRDMALLGFKLLGEEPRPLWEVYAR